jgi:hypothetical protein
VERAAVHRPAAAGRRLAALFEQHDGFRTSSGLLSSFGLGMFKTVVVPLLAMLLLLPLMISHGAGVHGRGGHAGHRAPCGARQFPGLERKQGGSLAGSVKTNLLGLLVFVPALAAADLAAVFLCAAGAAGPGALVGPG